LRRHFTVGESHPVVKAVEQVSLQLSKSSTILRLVLSSLPTQINVLHRFCTHIDVDNTPFLGSVATLPDGYLVPISWSKQSRRRLRSTHMSIIEQISGRKAGFFHPPYVLKEIVSLSTLISPQHQPLHFNLPLQADELEFDLYAAIEGL